MPAVGETTLAEKGPKLPESDFDGLPVQMTESKITHTGGVDDVATIIGQVIKLRVAGRVLTLTDLARQFHHTCSLVGYQAVNQ